MSLLKIRRMNLEDQKGLKTTEINQVSKSDRTRRACPCPFRGAINNFAGNLGGGERYITINK